MAKKKPKNAHAPECAGLTAAAAVAVIEKNDVAVIEKSDAAVIEKFSPNLMPTFNKGEKVVFNKTTAAFLVAGIFWHFESENRTGIDETLQVIDFANAENFGFSFGYEKSEDEKTYKLFVNKIHFATIFHSQDDNDAIQMRIEEFSSFEIQTKDKPDLETLGDNGRLSFIKYSDDGKIASYREFLGKTHERKGKEKTI